MLISPGWLKTSLPWPAILDSAEQNFPGGTKITMEGFKEIQRRVRSDPVATRGTRRDGSYQSAQRGWRGEAVGVVGLETALGLALELVHRGVIGAARMAEMMALKPARLLRLESGTLGVGRAADIAVIDPESRWTVDPELFLSLSRNTPFAGRELRGKAALTIVAGEIVYDGRSARAAR